MSSKTSLLFGISLWMLIVPIYEAPPVERRSLANFLKMALAALKRSPPEYIGYGNYCGLGGKGKPVDSIDSCCKIHDECYEAVNENECGSYRRNVKAIDYDWHMDGNQIVCDVKDKACGRAICNCDKDIIECLNENDNYYNPKYYKMFG